jgi:RNA recognition motif-containing protein
MSSSSSDAATILITNLQSSVTEDDVIELFSEIGHINEIKTLSRGCFQVIYSKEEEAEQAVSKYHNRLLDGQLMYVSLQQPTSYTTKSSKPTNESSKTKSNQISIDPSFIRQALFNPSTNTTNPVQFQVKL